MDPKESKVHNACLIDSGLTGLCCGGSTFNSKSLQPLGVASGPNTYLWDNGTLIAVKSFMQFRLVIYSRTIILLVPIFVSAPSFASKLKQKTISSICEHALEHGEGYFDLVENLEERRYLESERNQRFEKAQRLFHIDKNSLAGKLLELSRNYKLLSQDDERLKGLSESVGGLCGQTNITNILLAMDKNQNSIETARNVTDDIEEHKLNRSGVGTNAKDIANYFDRAITRKKIGFNVTVNKSSKTLDEFEFGHNTLKMIGTISGGQDWESQKSYHWFLVIAVNPESKEAILINPHRPNDIFIAKIEYNMGIRFIDYRLSRTSIYVQDEVAIQSK